MHPRKRTTGSIDNDLIAILTLPAVASGHLIWQIRMLMHKHHTTPSFNDDVERYAQYIAAIEAPFSVIESFTAVSVILFLIAVWKSCFRRAFCVAVVGLVCFATECYANFSNFKDLGLRYSPLEPENEGRPTFSRSFVADFTGLVLAILAILAMCATTASFLTIYILHSQIIQQNMESAEEGWPVDGPEDSQQVVVSPRSAIEADHSNTTQTSSTRSAEERARRTEALKRARDARLARMSLGTSMTLLPFSLFLSIFPSASNSYYFPRSRDSFSDLDQAVATAAGAVVFAFSIYSVAKALSTLETNESESPRLDHDQIPPRSGATEDQSAQSVHDVVPGQR